jgi:uncharacterized protein
MHMSRETNELANYLNARRDPTIDTMRALALFGVILMNVGAMVMRFNAADVMKAAGGIDMAVMAIELLLVQGKARSAFAFMFGLGFGILLMRGAQRPDFHRLYARRMLVLLAFGIVNQVFLFWGDILVTYALLGFVLLAMRNYPDRTILRLGLTLVIVPPLIVGGLQLTFGAIPGFIAADAAGAGAPAAMTSRDYLDAVAFNWSQNLLRHASDPAHMAVYDLGVLGLFLLGFWTARRGLLFEVAANRALLRRIAAVSIPLGLMLSAVAALPLMGMRSPTTTALAHLAYVGLPLLALGYIAGLCLLFFRRAKRLQAALAPVGRMALTGYLLSGAIGGLLFYGYGFGLLEEVDFAGFNLVALGLFTGLAVFSHLWLARFRLGPAEWLWRSLSEGTWKPLGLPTTGTRSHA